MDKSTNSESAMFCYEVNLSDPVVGGTMQADLMSDELSPLPSVTSDMESTYVSQLVSLKGNENTNVNSDFVDPLSTSEVQEAGVASESITQVNLSSKTNSIDSVRAVSITAAIENVRIQVPIHCIESQTTHSVTDESQLLERLKHDLHAELEDDDWKEEDDKTFQDSYNQSSPRACFLTGCLQAGIPPRMSAVLRKRLSTTLNLNNLGLGDQIAQFLASSINSIPFVKVVNIAGNNLTDDSIEPLVVAIQSNPHIEEIDISQNKIGPRAAHALSVYLEQPDCSLHRLHLRVADVDDNECAIFVQALLKNKSLKELDLSNNIIGKDEILNVIRPDILTGGESFALLLKDPRCVLETLKLYVQTHSMSLSSVLIFFSTCCKAELNTSTPKTHY